MQKDSPVFLESKFSQSKNSEICRRMCTYTKSDSRIQQLTLIIAPQAWLRCKWHGKYLCQTEFVLTMRVTDWAKVQTLRNHARISLSVPLSVTLLNDISNPAAIYMRQLSRPRCQSVYMYMYISGHDSGHSESWTLV